MYEYKRMLNSDSTMKFQSLLKWFIEALSLQRKMRLLLMDFNINWDESCYISISVIVNARCRNLKFLLKDEMNLDGFHFCIIKLDEMLL